MSELDKIEARRKLILQELEWWLNNIDSGTLLADFAKAVANDNRYSMSVVIEAEVDWDMEDVMFIMPVENGCVDGCSEELIRYYD